MTGTNVGYACDITLHTAKARYGLVPPTPVLLILIIPAAL